MRRYLLPFLALAVAALAPAQSLDDYLKLRKARGIKQPISMATLDTIVGTRVVELSGTIKGSFRVGDKGALMLDRGDGNTEIVDCDEIPDWLASNEVKARLLLKVSKADEASEMHLSLVSAAPESQVAEYDEAPTPSAAKKVLKRSTRSLGSRHASRNFRRTGPLPQSSVTGIYARRIMQWNPRLDADEATEIATYLIGYCLQYEVDARLIVAMIMAESSFNPYATSRTGAQGLGQLMPGTASELGVEDSYSIEQNLSGMVRLMRSHLDKYRAKTGNEDEAVKLAVAAYNAGGGAVDRYNGIPPYAETQNYVRKVTAWYAQLKSGD